MEYSKRPALARTASLHTCTSWRQRRRRTVWNTASGPHWRGLLYHTRVQPGDSGGGGPCEIQQEVRIGEGCLITHVYNLETAAAVDRVEYSKRSASARAALSHTCTTWRQRRRWTVWNTARGPHRRGLLDHTRVQPGDSGGGGGPCGIQQEVRIGEGCLITHVYNLEKAAAADRVEYSKRPASARAALSDTCTTWRQRRWRRTVWNTESGPRRRELLHHTRVQPGDSGGGGGPCEIQQAARVGESCFITHVYNLAT